ncbi:cobalamin biosynthesis protein CobD, partial [bacterium]
MDFNLYAILIAYFLDLIFGDPEWQMHPVRIIGKMIAGLEKWLNVPSDNKILRGFILSLIVICSVGGAVWASLRLAWIISPVIYFFLSTLLIYFGLSVRDLAVQAHRVRMALADRNIPQAREQLARIVGRDTGALDEPEIVRASVETVAESAMDGIIAPLFYCFLGGPALMWVYKAVNTLDSMVGYRNQRFIEFGRVSAKLDAMMNFIPARITSFLIGVSGGVCGKD